MARVFNLTRLRVCTALNEASNVSGLAEPIDIQRLMFTIARPHVSIHGRLLLR